MSQRYLMGFDLGGGGVRCLLADAASGATTVALRPWTFEVPQGIPTGAELDPARTWALLCEASREVLARVSAGPDQVVAVGTSGMRHAGALLDTEGREIFVASNHDARGLAENGKLAATAGATFHRRTGAWPGVVHPLGRLQWTAQHAPDRWAEAATHLSLSDWLGFRMTGALASEASQAGCTLLFDLQTRDWAWDLVDSAGLPRELFPDVREAGTSLGLLRAEAAAALGLSAGIPVAVGGGDTQCGLLGVGAVAPGSVAAILGTSSPIQRVTDSPVRDADGRLWSGHHLPAGRWVIESNAGGIGEALTWIAGLLYAESDHPVLALLAEAETSRPGAAGMASTFGVSVMDARNLELPIGDLTLSHLAAAGEPARRRHLARAVIEGIAFGLRANLEQALDADESSPDSVRVAGGLSRSPFFTQLLADVWGRPVEVSATPEASALGAAICAGVAAGVCSDLDAGAARFARVARRHAPDPERAATYAELGVAWNALREARGPSVPAATGLVVRGLTAEGEPGATGTTSSAFRPRILVTAEMDEEGLAALQELGDVEYASFKQKMRLLTGPALVEALRGVHVLVAEVDVVDGPALAQADDLRVVASCRGDAVNVDAGACTELGIPVLNAPGRNADGVADLTVSFLLMLARKLPEATAFLREAGGEPGDMGRMGRAFGTLQGRELWRKTVGLVGLGAVGRKVVARLRPFGVRCLVHDPFLDPDAVRLAGAEPSSLEGLLAESDFVSLHAAVTQESRGLIGTAELDLMRPGTFLVNTARAALVDEEALVAALASGHLGGAALDVFSVEPPGSEDPLLAFPNVIATPHVGGNTAEVAVHQGAIIADELARLSRGEAPRFAVNPEVLDRFRWDEPRPAPDDDLRERIARRATASVTDLQRDDKKPRKAPAAETRTAPAPAEPPTPATDAAGVAEMRRTLEQILERFVDGILADDALGAFAEGQDVMLHFALHDLGSEFHVGFRDDAVVGGMGAPEATAEVQLKLPADLLDGMFTGRRNAMQAAMEGELSFSGDTAKAMTLTHIQADLERLYTAAREAVGDPGDLTALPDATGSAPVPSAVPAGDDDLRALLVNVVDELYTAQLITATGGNVSVRSQADPEEAWITPSQLFKGDLCPELLVRIGMDGRALDPSAKSPSSEALMHTAVYQVRPDAQAVIHAHAPNATILANAGLPFLPISTEAAFFQNLGRIPFVMPGTQALADAIIEAMAEGWAVLMQNHGLLVAGRSLRRAADMAEVIERTCEVILGCRAVGVDPPVLPPDVVEMLSKYGDMMA